MNVAEPEILSLVFTALVILVHTLPTMQLEQWQFGQRFRCVTLQVANLASSC